MRWSALYGSTERLKNGSGVRQSISRRHSRLAEHRKISFGVVYFRKGKGNVSGFLTANETPGAT